ncbi:hypothetical protein [Deinococcus sp. NW-56]|uniref:hypothetical protein n=1 Tax=Deinococcus sp. NW-56 TaxID=2080419 RepID=UPI000CF3B553|nr:hypothetical protein [Deinococcus sp. NW-56]
MTKRSLGHLTATTGIDRSGFQRDRQQLLRDAGQTQLSLTLRVDTKLAKQETRQALASLRGDATQALTLSLRVKLDDAGLKRQADRLQGLNDKAITMKLNVVGVAEATQELNALKVVTSSIKGDLNLPVRLGGGGTQSTVAASREQAAAARAAKAEHDALTASLRAQSAQIALSAKLSLQAAREDKIRTQQSIGGLENEMRAYRALWQARQLGTDEVIAAQRRIHEQALLQAAAVDKTSDAYRRLTQVAAGAQRNIDQAQGINTPGGFAAGISQGIVQALGNLGPFGQLLEQVVNAGMAAAQEAAREGAQDVGRDAGLGLTKGLGAQREQVKRAAMNTAKAVKDGAEEELDIHSPSRVMHRVGAFAGEGLADGLLSKKAEVAAAAKQLANAAETNGAPALNTPGVSGGGMGGVAVVPAMQSAQAGLGKVAAQAALTTALIGGTALAVGALGVGFVNGAKKAAEFEHGLAEMSLLTNKLPEQMGETGQAILKMTVDVNRSFGELKAGYEEILGASVRGTDDDAAVLRFLRTSASLSKVARTEVKVAADALTSILNAYEMDASQAAQVSDMLWASIKAGKVSLDQAAGSLGATAGQAKALGVPLDELLSAMALLTTRGIPASTALEYIRSALSNVQKPSKEAAATADDLGVKFNAAALKSMGLVKFLDQLGRGVGDNSEALATMIGDVGGLQAVLGLLNGGLSDTDGILQDVRESTGAVDRDVVKLKDTAVENAKAFSVAWERAQISFSTGVLPMLTSALTWSTDFLNKLVEINAELKKMGEGKAAYGAEAYDLDSWLEQTGLRQSDLTPAELKQVKDLLTRIQAQANRGAQNSAMWENLGLPGVAGFNDRNTAQAIGQLGAQLGAIQAAVSQRARVQGPERGGNAATDVYDSPTNSTEFQSAVARTAAQLQKTGVRTADEVVNYCAQWVRLTLGKADQRVTSYVNKLFQADRDGDRDIDARDAAAGAKNAGLLRPYTGVQNLKPGDVVFYTENGQNHTGIYIGGGMVRGNNRVTYQQNGGRFGPGGIASGEALDAGRVNPVGNVAIGSLGRVSGYISAADLGRAAGVTERTGSGSQTTTGGSNRPPAPVTAEQIIQAQRFTAALEKAQAALKKDPGSVPLTQAVIKAKRELDGFRKASEGNAEALDALQKQGVKTSGTYIATSADLRQWGSEALRLYKDLEKAEKSGSSAAATAAQARVDAWIGESEARKAVFTAEGAAYKTRQQNADAADRDETTRAQNRAKTRADLAKALEQGRIGDAQRYLDRLKADQAEAIALAKDDAAKRAKIIAETGPAILAAEDRLINARRGQRIREAQRVADEAKKLPGADLDAIEKTRVAAVREAYREAEAERRKARQSQTAAERSAGEAATQEAQQRATQRAELERRLNADLAAGRLTQAQATVDKLQQALDTELAAHKNNAAERLRVEQELGPKVLAAQKRVLEAQRDAAVSAARATATAERGKLTAEYGKGKEPKDLLAKIASTETSAITTAETTFNTRLSALYSASAERINSATAAVQAKNKQAAEQRVQTEKEVTSQLAAMNQSQRQEQIQREEDALTRLRQSQETRLAAVKGNEAATLQVIQETSGKIREQEDRLALTRLVAAKRQAEEEKQARLDAIPKGATKGERDRLTAAAETERLGKVSAAYRAYSLAVSKSAQDAAQAVQQATEQQTRAAQEQQRLARENEAALRTVSREGLEGRLADAEAARDRELAAAEGNLAEQLRIETERGAEILALQRRLAEARRNEEAASLRAQAQQKKTTNAETFKGDPARIAAEDAKVDTWLTGALGNLQSRFYAQIGKVEAEAAARLTRSGEALTAAEEDIATGLLEQREQTLQTITESTTALFNSGADFEEQARGRADAIGTVAGAIRQLTGLKPDQATLDDLADLPTLYDRIMQAGLDLEGMDLTSLEALSELLGGFVSRDRDFLPVEQAREFAAALEAAGGTADELREALAMPEGDRTLILNARRAIQSGDTDVLTGVMESLAGRDLKSSPALANLRAAVDAALATLGDQAAARARRAMEATWEGQRGVVQGQLDDLERRAPQMDEGAVIEERARLQADLASMEWEAQETRLYAEDATNEEIATARAAFGRRLIGIEQTRADAQAALTLRRAREVEDARAALELQALDNRAALGLMGEEAHQQERERLQLEAAARQRDRAIKDAGEDAAKVQAARDAYALTELQITGQRQARARQAQIDGARATQDALLHEEQTGLEVRKARGLVGDLQYVEESGRLQLEARKVQRDRELQDAKGNWDLMLAALRRYNADKAQIEAQTAAESARIRLDLQRAAEDAAANLAQAKLEERIALGQLSARDAQAAREQMELDAAERAHARAVADAKGDADRIKAADLALEAERTRIRTQGATDRRSIALDEADWEIAQAQRRVDRSGGVSGNRALQTALARKLELTRQQLSEITDQDSPEYIAALGRMQAAEDALTEAKVSQINVFGNYAQQLIPGLVGAMQVLGGVGEEVAQGWGESLGSMVSDVVNFATLLAKGDYVGAAIAAFTSIFTGFARQMAEVRAELKRTEEYGKQFRFNADGYGTREVTHTKTGFLWWAKNVYTEEIDELGKTLALSFENAVVSGVQSGFAEAVAKGDASILEKSITTNLKGAAFQGLTEAFLNSAGVAALLGPLVQKLMEAFKSGNKDLINQALADFKAGVASMRGELDALVETGQAIEGILDPEAEARRQEEAARDLADRRLNTEETLLKALHTSGLIGTEEYERRKLDLALARIRAEMEAALAAEGLTQEQIAAIREGYEAQLALTQAEYDAQVLDRARQQAREIADLRLGNAERGLELERRRALMGASTEEERHKIEEDYRRRRLELTLRRLELEMQAALENEELTQEQIDLIRQEHALERQSAEMELEEFLADRRRQLAEREAEEARRRAEELKNEQDSILNAWSGAGASAFMEGLETQNFDGFFRKWKGELTKATIQGIVEAEMGRMVADELRPLAERYRAALKTQGTADDLAALRDLREGVRTVADGVRPLYEALLPAYQDLKNELADNTEATRENTDATRQAQFQQTTMVTGVLPPPRRDTLRARLTR